MTKRKPKVGGRVVWQYENMPKEFGTIVATLGQKIHAYPVNTHTY